MKRNLLSWVSTLMLLFLGLVQVAQAQKLNEKKSDSNNAFDIYFVGTDTTASGPGDLKQGLISLKFKIEALKNENIENVYIKLPANGSIISPVGFYTSTNAKGNNGNGSGNNGNGPKSVTKRYRVLPTKHLLPNTFTAEHAVKFEAIGGKKAKSNKKVKIEEFEILLSEAEYATMTTMHVAVESSEEGLDKQTDVKHIGYTHFDLFEQDGKRINRQVNTGNGSKLNTANRRTITPLADCAPLPAIDGNADLCYGEIVKFTLPIVAGIKYKDIKWSVPTVGVFDNLPSNWQIIEVPNAPINELYVKVGDVSGTVSASVTVEGCGTRVVSMATFIGDEIPVTITTVGGNGDSVEVFKPKEILIFNAHANQNRDKREYTYTWKVPAGWIVYGGQGTSQLVVQAGNSEGFVELNVKSKYDRTLRNCGDGYAWVEMILEPTCDAPPLTPGEIETPDEICTTGDKTYRYEVKNPDHTTYNYSFLLPDEFQEVSRGPGYIDFKVVAGTKPATYLVTVVKAYKKKCGAETICIPAEVKNCQDSCPEPVVNLTIPSPLCNIRNFEFSHAVQQGVTYEYFFPEGFDVVELGDGKLSVDIVLLDEELLNTPLTLRVVATNECGQSVTHERIVFVGECDNGNPLPVTLTSFEGASRSGSVELAWSTASEINNDRFEVERSANGKEFKKVGEVKGNGNSAVLVDYTYTDRSAASGTVYYRLKQVDFDGQSEYSKVIAVTHTASASNATLSVYPNPVENGKVNLRFQEQVDGTTTIRLTDMSGRVLHSQEARNVGAEHELNLTGLNLKAGIYMISVTANGQSTTQRIMVR